MFLKAEDELGQAILEDGRHTIMFIKLLALKELNFKRRKVLEKYLISMLSDNVKTNEKRFNDFKSLYYPRKSIDIVSAFSEKI